MTMQVWTESCYGAQGGLQLLILQSQSPKKNIFAFESHVQIPQQYMRKIKKMEMWISPSKMRAFPLLLS